MDHRIRRVAAIHDLSGFGRASLTAIIPTLSSMGVQVCPLPTAILSNHTGGFEHYSFVDLTDTMEDYIDHWKRLGLTFDCLYSGFLGSERQIEIVGRFIDHFGTADNLTVVDPVMGDNGRLYSTMGPAMVGEMRRLIGKADMITPNFTEAALLLGESYRDRISDEEIRDWLRRLSAMGPSTVVITSVPGVRLPGQETGMDTHVIAYDRRGDVFWKTGCRYIPAAYPGTGDTFTSVVIGGLLQGDSLPVAIDRGVQFISQCIRASYGFDYPKREGVLLERELDILRLPVLTGGFEML
ncbi:MAG: pyridoxamine kinase [Clostridiales bacterium]|nr:pyridoxamine kinase [Clostridiales bacterium]